MRPIRSAILWALALSVTLLSAHAASGVQLSPGDLLVASLGNDSVVHIDPDTGVQTVVSAGGLISSPWSIVVDGQGKIFVGGASGPDIVEVDAASGAQQVVNSGSLLLDVFGISIDQAGDIVAVDTIDTVWRADRQTGTEQALSVGGGLSTPTDSVVEADGQILVVSSGNNAVYRIEPSTGAQTLLWSDPLTGPWSIALENSTSAFVLDRNNESILRLDLVSGVATVVQTDPLLGNQGIDANTTNGLVYIADSSNSRIVRLDTTSGAVGIVASGGDLDSPWDVAVVPPLSCPATPATGCTTGSGATLRIKKKSDPSRDALTWKLRRATFAAADLGSPDTDTTMAMCLYADGALAMSAVIDAAGVCDGKPCWKALGTRGFKYKNRDGNASGITKATLKEGTGKGSILIKGKGASLAPPLPLTVGSGVTAQLIRFDAPQCWEAAFPSFIKSDDESFKARF